jgi:hypothetical protein
LIIRSLLTLVRTSGSPRANVKMAKRMAAQEVLLAIGCLLPTVVCVCVVCVCVSDVFVFSFSSHALALRPLSLSPCEAGACDLE